ncbi:AAA family ATPase [Maridesulfovibrio bastinii]|uniref:cytidylate kinase-like family protein n=1 Tax=Maridesulfovibrio bastinii TaxID=47157 RepID=UPI00042170FD|nr:cytidylate kinase-like family protein [Maridesulfovibrio bastinii]
MAIITISRGSYSKGKEIAEKVASCLGYSCTSRDIILESSEEFNIPEIKLVRALHDSPSVLNRFVHGKERYLAHIRSALLQSARKDNLVYHGLAGHYFLMNIPNVFKIRITADINTRVAEEMTRENISAEKAEYILRKDDEERRKWGLQIYGIDPWDSRLYDMTLHIGTFKVEDAVEIICEQVKKGAFKTTEKAQKWLDDLALAATVKVAIIDVAPMAEVTADSGVVSINSTRLNTSVSCRLYDQIMEKAAKVDGVSEVKILGTGKIAQRVVNPFHHIE